MAFGMIFPDKVPVLGPMPANATTGSDRWDGLDSVTFWSGGINPFSMVKNPAGSGIVLRCENRLNYPTTTEGKHTTAGTQRDEGSGDTVYFAASRLWATRADYTALGWSLIEQLQEGSVSPIQAWSQKPTTLREFMQTRDGSKTQPYDLWPIEWGHWATLIVGVHIADRPNGWIEWWGRQGATPAWPDISQKPDANHSRRGIDTYVGSGKHTIGVYSEHGFAKGAKICHFGPAGRGSTAAEALANAKIGARNMGFLELAA